MFPSTPTGEIDDATLLRIVQELRAYSKAWQEKGRAPPKMVYNQTTCGWCHGKVKMERLGPNGGRPTFSCADCVAGGGRTQKKRKREAASAPSAPPPAGACAQHPKATTLKRVRKDGPNLARLFFGCRARDCSHFAWGDGNFGQCECKKTAGLRVTKKGPNTGKVRNTPRALLREPTRSPFFCVARSGS